MPVERAYSIVAILLSAGFLTACSEAPKSAEKEPGRPVLVQTVKFEPSKTARSFAGTIKTRIETDQGFRITGKVMERLVQVGDRVKAGQPLGTLDTADLKLQIDQAEADLSAAKGSLAQALADEQRQMALRANGWTPTATLEKANAAADEARGRVTRTQRALELAQNSLGYATLTADGDGVVTATAIEPGQVIASGQMAVRVARLAEKEAVVAIPESLVDIVRHSAAKVTLWSDPKHAYAATLREFSPSADAATRTYQARFTISQAPTEMELGMTATVTLTEPNSGDVARLPLSALFSQADKSSVYVVDSQGSLALKPVEVQAYESSAVLIRSGVQDGDKVVTLGVQKLDTDQKVRVVERQS
jgi:RND family efflux transporter MFP subunit